MSSIKDIKQLNGKLLIGRSEWCALPMLSIPAIRAKIDTGAKTSSIHAMNMEKIVENGVQYIKFDVDPIQDNDDIIVSCKSLIVDRKWITSSSGHKEYRYVVSTPIKIADQTWDIELTLSDRTDMKFKMLLGRGALSNRAIIDTSIVNNQSNIKKSNVYSFYK